MQREEGEERQRPTNGSPTPQMAAAAEGRMEDRCQDGTREATRDAPASRVSHSRVRRNSHSQPPPGGVRHTLTSSERERSDRKRWSVEGESERDMDFWKHVCRSARIVIFCVVIDRQDLRVFRKAKYRLFFSLT